MADTIEIDSAAEVEPQSPSTASPLRGLAKLFSPLTGKRAEDKNLAAQAEEKKRQDEERNRLLEKVRNRQEKAKQRAEQAEEDHRIEKQRAELERIRKKKEEMRSLFDDLKNVDKMDSGMRMMAPFMKDPDSTRARLASVQYLAGRYALSPHKISKDYQLYQHDYAKQQWGETRSMNALEFYTRLGKDVKAEKAREDVMQSAGARARRAAILGTGHRQQAIRDWRSEFEKQPGYSPDALAEYIREYDAAREIITPHLAPVREALAAMQREEKGVGTEKDKEARDRLAWQLVNMRPRERRAVMLLILGEEGQQGMAAQMGSGSRRGVGGSFSGSMMRTFEDMFGTEAFQNGTIESYLEKIDPNEPQPAERYLAGPADAIDLVYYVTHRNYIERVAKGMPNEHTLPPRRPARALDVIERRQLELAKEDVARKIQMSRELLQAARATDPFDESIWGKMAAGTGSSLAAMAPVLILGPQGALLSGMGYANSEYESLRRNYPEMPLKRVRELSVMSAVVQASLDVLGVRALKAAPSLAGLLTKPSVEVGKRVLTQGGKTYLLENVVELLQDHTTPAIHRMMQALHTDMPGVDWERELKHFWKGRLDVALGMIPLTLLGMGMTTVNEVTHAKGLLSDNAYLGRAGLQESDRILILEHAANGKLEEAQQAMQDAWQRRSPEEAAKWQQETENQQAIEGVDQPGIDMAEPATSSSNDTAALAPAPDLDEAEQGAKLSPAEERFEDVRPGHMLTRALRAMPNDDVAMPPGVSHLVGLDKAVPVVEQWLQAIVTATDPEGRRVLVAHPEKGSLRNRAEHLIGERLPDGTRRYDPDKGATVMAVPGTIAQPHAIATQRAKGGLARLYIRRYRNGDRHFVFVYPLHQVKAQGVLKEDGALLSQYVPSDIRTFKDAKITWIRPPSQEQTTPALSGGGGTVRQGSSAGPGPLTQAQTAANASPESTETAYAKIQKLQREFPHGQSFSPAEEGLIPTLSRSNAQEAAALGLPVAGTTIKEAQAHETVTRALKSIAQDGTLPSKDPLRVVASALAQADFHDVTLVMQDSGGARMVDARTGGTSRYAGGHAGVTQTMTLNLAERGRGGVTTKGVLVHESLHHVVGDRLKNPQTQSDRVIAHDLTKMMHQAKEHAHAKGISRFDDYEFDTVDEFYTAVATRRDLQELLHEMPAAGGSGFRNLWQQFVNFVSRLIGREVRPGRSALDDAVGRILELVGSQPSANIDPTGEAADLSEARQPSESIPESQTAASTGSQVRRNDHGGIAPALNEPSEELAQRARESILQSNDRASDPRTGKSISLIAAENLLREGAAANVGQSRSEARDKRFEAERAILAEAAKEAELSGTPVKGGHEHRVHHDEATGRASKATKNGRYGIVTTHSRPCQLIRVDRALNQASRAQRPISRLAVLPSERVNTRFVCAPLRPSHHRPAPPPERFTLPLVRQ